MQSKRMVSVPEMVHNGAASVAAVSQCAPSSCLHVCPACPPCSAFGAHLDRLRADFGCYGALGLAELLEMREECLREFGFEDVYRQVWRGGEVSSLTGPQRL